MKKLLEKAKKWIEFKYYYTRFRLCRDGRTKEYYRCIAKETLYEYYGM